MASTASTLDLIVVNSGGPSSVQTDTTIPTPSDSTTTKEKPRTGWH
jgi:hypothetical protein